MSEPEMPQKEPYATDVVKGETYYWCACGKSKKQPFCDGSHQGSEFSPLSFVAQETGTVYLCGCKRTAKPPFCDGTHSKL
jgi:CDGSH-type Zn-finger protein